MSVIQGIGAALLGFGTAISVLAALGVVRFPSAISRMHAATKSASLGLAALVLGAGAFAGSWGLFGIGLLVTVFLFVTAPISGHLLGRATYLAGQAGDLVRDDLADARWETFALGRPARPRFSVFRWLGLAAVWVALWRDLSVGTVIGGLVVASLVETLRKSYGRGSAVHPWGLLVFLVHYAGAVLMSNIRVAWEVITPSIEQIREAIVAVPLKVTSVEAALLVANAVSFTPGTLTVELTADPAVLFVHVLHFTSVDDVRRDVERLERLVERALPAPVDRSAPSGLVGWGRSE